MHLSLNTLNLMHFRLYLIFRYCLDIVHEIFTFAFLLFIFKITLKLQIISRLNATTTRCSTLDHQTSIHRVNFNFFFLIYTGAVLRCIFLFGEMEEKSARAISKAKKEKGEIKQYHRRSYCRYLAVHRGLFVNHSDRSSVCDFEKKNSFLMLI